MIAVDAIRLLYAVPGWSFIRMMDMQGRETKCSVLVKLEIDDV
jgi:phosphatidylinositol phospholipase C delta